MVAGITGSSLIMALMTTTPATAETDFIENRIVVIMVEALIAVGCIFGIQGLLGRFVLLHSQ